MLITILAWAIFGALAGFIGRAIMPGAQPMPLWMTILLGIAGALIGGFIGRALGLSDGNDFDFGSLVLAGITAFLLLFIVSKTRRV